MLGIEADFDEFVNGFGELFDRCEETCEGNCVLLRVCMYVCMYLPHPILGTPLVRGAFGGHLF